MDIDRCIGAAQNARGKWMVLTVKPVRVPKSHENKIVAIDVASVLSAYRIIGTSTLAMVIPSVLFIYPLS